MAIALDDWQQTFLVFNAALKGQAGVLPEGHRDGVRTLAEGEAISVQVCRYACEESQTRAVELSEQDNAPSD